MVAYSAMVIFVLSMVVDVTHSLDVIVVAFSVYFYFFLNTLSVIFLRLKCICVGSYEARLGSVKVS